MTDHHNDAAGMPRRGLIIGALATAGLAASGGVAAADPSGRTGSGQLGISPASAVPASGDPFRYTVPTYRTAVPDESIEADRVDHPVAPGIVLTSFDTFGRTGWLRVHVLNADLGDESVGVDLIADKVSGARALSAATDAQHAVAAVNGDYFDITETYAAEGPEIQDGRLRKGTDQPSTVAAVGADRVARLADLVIAGTVTVAGTQRPLTALNSASVPADGISVFTPQWGPGTAPSSRIRARTPNWWSRAARSPPSTAGSPPRPYRMTD